MSLSFRHGYPVVVMLGLPGAGKGTQSVRLAAALEVPHISTGDLIRTAMRDGDERAEMLRELVGRGDLVPDGVTTGLLLGRLQSADAGQGCVLDGFPRTVAQARELAERLVSRETHRITAIHLDVPIPVLVERLAGRRVCAAAGHPYHMVGHPPILAGRCDVDGSQLERRADDDPVVIERRLELQRAALVAVLDFHRRMGTLRELSGDASESDVADAIRSALAAAQSDAGTGSPTDPDTSSATHRAHQATHWGGGSRMDSLNAGTVGGNR